MSKDIIPFLEKAPPGEYEQCSAALNSIVSNPSTIQSARSATINKWNEKECNIVEVNGHNAIICAEGKLGQGEYLDAVTNQPFSYNFESRSVTPGSSPAPESSPLRDAIQKEIGGYIETTYRENSAAGAYISGNSIIIIRTSTSSSPSKFLSKKFLFTVFL